MFESLIGTQRVRLKKVLKRDSKKVLTQDSKIGSHTEFKNRFLHGIQK